LAKKGTKKQKAVLTVLVALLAVFWINNLFFKGSGKVVEKADTGKAFSLGVVPPANMPDVDLDVLARLNVPVEVSRNIFDPVYRPPVVKPVITPKPKPAAAGAGRPNPDYVPPPPPPPPMPREQIEYNKAMDHLKKFRFVGFITRKGKTDLFIANDGDYYVAHAGETIAEGYYVKAIKTDALIIADRAHKFDGKEPEVSIPADFQGKEADVITGESAPYVGAGATGGSSTGGGGAPAAPSNQHRQYQRGPASGGRRSPAQPPRGVGTVPEVPNGGRAAQPIQNLEEETTTPDGLGGYSVP